MNCGANLCGEHPRPESITIAHADDVQVIDALRIRRLKRENQVSTRIRKQFVIESGLGPALLVPLLQLHQFNLQQTGLDRIEPAIIPLDLVIVPFGLSMIADHPDLARKYFIIRSYRPALATCS